MTLTRYDMIDGKLTECTDGDYVRRDDHLAALDKVTKDSLCLAAALAGRQIGVSVRTERDRWFAFAGPDGDPRKVLFPSRGPQLHLTEDGALVPDPSCFVWSYETRGKTEFTGEVIQMLYGTWFNKRWDDCLPARWTDNAPDGKWACYSTKELAQSAKESQ